MTEKQAVLFDMDGTLLDTFGEMKREQKAKHMALFTRYFNHRMKKLPSYSYTEMMKMIEQDWLMRPFQTIIKKKLNEQMVERYHRAKLKDGALAFLTYLKKRGYILNLCTNNARHIVELTLKDKALDTMFTHVITSQDVERAKPDPQMYDTARLRCGVEASACIIFEDMLEGIEAANSANIECIAVYDEFNKTDEEAIRSGSIMIIQDYTDKRLYEIF